MYYRYDFEDGWTIYWRPSVEGGEPTTALRLAWRETHGAWHVTLVVDGRG